MQPKPHQSRLIHVADLLLARYRQAVEADPIGRPEVQAKIAAQKQAVEDARARAKAPKTQTPAPAA